jgi:glycosyltransferase involved in cell wall biosynthesis
MRIALVTTELRPGGAEKCIVNLACYLQKQGHVIQVWQLWPAPPPEKSQLVKQLDDHGILWSSGQAVKAWQFWSATRWLKRELVHFHPDIVQSFLFHANLSTALAVRNLHCRLFGGARVSQPERWRQLLQSWAANRMEKMICVSHSVANHVAKYERISEDKLSVIPNGIELIDLSTPIRVQWSGLGLPPHARVLLFVGRLTDQKGIVDFISQSATGLLRQLPDHHLVLMGDGIRSQELHTACQKSPMAERIHQVGWQADAIEWMRLAETIVLPAKYEGMPNVILEAMSVGKPVASFDVDGVRELLGESSTAKEQMAQSQDFAALETIILRLAQSNDLRATCGINNRQRAKQSFQLTDQLAKYEQLYLSTPSVP